MASDHLPLWLVAAIITDMISLNCPTCSAPLELDDGFRGGVCRCSGCGTLMTVPHDPSTGRAESLTRPETPGAAPQPETAAQVYTTATGKKVKLTDKQASKAPVAHKRRKQVRMAVFAMAAAVVVLLSGGVVALGVFLLYRPAPVVETAQDIYAKIFVIEDNPYTTAEPQFMGLPVPSSLVMLIDGSSAMRNHIDLAKQAVLRSVPTLGSRKVRVVFWSEVAPIAYPDAMTAASDVDAAALATKLDEISLTGSAQTAPAFALAAADKPHTIVLVARMLPDEAATAAAQAQLKEAGSKLVVVHLDGFEQDPDAVRIKAVAEATGGQYIALSSARLQRWYQQYLDTQ